MKSEIRTIEILKEIDAEISKIQTRLTWSDIPLMEKNIIINHLWEARFDVKDYRLRLENFGKER